MDMTSNVIKVSYSEHLPGLITVDLHENRDHGNPAESGEIRRRRKSMLRGSRGYGNKIVGFPRDWSFS